MLITQGELAVNDEGAATYRVVSSGGIPIDNGNGLEEIIYPTVSLDEFYKQAPLYTAIFSAEIYIVTPVSGVFPAKFDGLVIEFDLPDFSAPSARARINYNESVQFLDWIDGSQTAAFDIDSSLNKRIKCISEGAGWRILSDISGENVRGQWERRANGVQECRSLFSLTTTVTQGSVIGGAAQNSPTISHVRPFSSVPTPQNTTGTYLSSASMSVISELSYLIRYRTITASSSMLLREVFTTITGRWYQ